MARRLPSAPPILAGFVHQHVLGTGGFADVYLYEQNLPRRQVAVKVLLSEIVDESLRGMFRAEVNVMAQLSAHPSILTVYQAGVAADGRPYMVMELCSGALNDRYRRERLPVSEVLQIAIQVGSALETAHRSGVLHRDLKPANILLTAYGHPVLSDFGIASTLGDSQLAVGMSVPWSAPEMLVDGLLGDVRSEVYSFAATIYSLLAGRSPCEIPGKAASVSELTARIDRGKVFPINRRDVPASLERALRRALDRAPAARPAAVLDLVREFQSCENELGLVQTPSEVEATDWALIAASSREEQTHVRAVSSSLPLHRRRFARPVGLDSAAGNGNGNGNGNDSGGGSNNAGSGSRDRRSATGARGERMPSPNHRPIHRPLLWHRLVLAFTGLAVIFGVGVTAVAIALGRPDPLEIPVVANLRADGSDGSVRFSWNDPGVREVDRYLITSPNQPPIVQTSSSFVIDARPGERVCISVTVTRGGRSGQPSGSACGTVNP